MKSIKLKIIMLALGCVILSSTAIGFTSYFNAQRVVKNDSTKIMNLLCDNRSENFNEVFKRVEQSVETLSIYAKRDIENLDLLTSNIAYVHEFSSHIATTALDAARNTEGAISVYIRLDPSIGDGKSGVFLLKNLDDGQFYNEEPTDLSLYNENETEHVGWFYQPKKEKKAVWLDPYFNKNIDRKIISYVVPIYIDTTFIGVVGMDIDFNLLESIVADTNIYKSGYAFLTDKKANIVYHKSIHAGTNLIDYNDGEFKEMARMLTKSSTSNDELIVYPYEGSMKEATFRSLKNGMRFVVTAPKKEIDAELQQLLIQILVATFVFISIAILIAIIFARRLVRPLQELTVAAKQVADGNLHVDIKHRSKDEVGLLAESFRQTVIQLDHYFTNINMLAYEDSLTGLQNKTAYMDNKQNLQVRFHERNLRFSLVVLDLNGLKDVNDHWGHAIGDSFIAHAAELIREVFVSYPIYRIGGDEFVVILEEDDYYKHDILLQKFTKAILYANRINNGIIKVSVASGIAHFDPSIDSSYDDVFKRADNEMYQCKSKMKHTENKKL